MALDRPLVLSGPPGSGKSATGPALAARLGYAHVDLDALIEFAAGSPVHEIFAREGEATFRAWERDALTEALRGRRVVVRGGEHAPSRHRAGDTRAGARSSRFHVRRVLRQLRPGGVR